ncbi:MAG: tryptophan 7-halogenase [Janthinobacterium lividum]
MTTVECDILVVGGGPAGSTAAALLAEAGHDVLLVEKARHPRFHIGESLLPRNTELLERLGLVDRVAAIGVHKPGAEFVSDETGTAVQFSFAEGLDRRFTSSWQVRRAEFDALLFQAAVDRGARTMQDTRVIAVEPGAAGRRGRVQTTGPAGDFAIAPRYVLDASGRDTLMAGKLGSKRSDKRTNSAAVYGHYTGVAFREGALEGYISVHLVADGWFWMIPLPDGVMSVGFVGNPAVFKGRAGSAAALLAERIALSPSVSARMRHAELASEVVATGNYSYASSTMGGDGYLMIGDAFAFLDPVFSSGVLLAMTSGEKGAAVAAAWLADPARSRVMARAMEREMRHAMQRIAWLITRINTPALRLLFMAPRNVFRMRDGLVSLLAGNLRGTWGSVFPVLAFKGVYHVTTLLLRLGLQRPTARAAADAGTAAGAMQAAE